MFSYQNKVNDHAPECGEVDVQLAVRGHVADQQDAGGKTKRLFFTTKTTIVAENSKSEV